MTESKVAIVYDNLTTKYGGAEVVLKTLLTAFPKARVYSTVSTLDKSSWLGEREVTTSFLQKLPPFLRKRHQLQAILAPLAIESLKITEPIVISITAGAGKGILTRPNQVHICYLLTPTRYLYDSDSALNSANITKLVGVRWVARGILKYLRWWDYVAGQRPDLYVAISNLVSQRLTATYNRKADEVIYPPFIPEIVHTPKELGSLSLPAFLFSVGRHVWYKRIDVLIEYAKTARTPTIIAGEGASAKRWQKLAGHAGVTRPKGQSLQDALSNWNHAMYPIIFVGAITKEEKVFLFQKARAYVMPGIEDFGLTALEALYYGCPTVVNRSSGVAEILDQKVAVFLEDTSVLEITQAVAQLRDMKISHTLLKDHAVRYSEAEFRRKFVQYLQKRSPYVRT